MRPGLWLLVSLTIPFLFGMLVMRYQPLWTAARTGRKDLIRRVIRRIPFFSTIDAKLTLSHITGVLARLLASGIPIDRALVDCADLDIGLSFRRLMLRVCERVKKGLSLSDALRDERSVPKSMKTMISIGETSGLLPESLSRITLAYERQAVSSMRVFADTVAPLVVVVAGSVTLLVTLSVHLVNVGIVESLLNSM